MSVNIDNYNKILATSLKYNAKLIAVSKTKPIQDIKELYTIGQKDFAENYVQEFIDKEPQLSENILWHFIGHLQSNKVKSIIPLVHLIHGVDSIKLLQEINKQAEKIGIEVDCLLQIHIAKEESKFGFDEAEAEELMLLPAATDLLNVNIRGVMGMATLTEDKAQIKIEFLHLKRIFDNCKLMSPFPRNFNILSMGMTSDFEIALDCGSTMIRIGSAIFGERIKN